MKYALCAALLAASSLLASASTVAASSDATPAPALIKLSYLSLPAQRSDLLQLARPQAQPIQLVAALASCWNFDGNSCSTPTTRIRCQWQPYEPGICVCQGNNTWICY